MNTSGIDEPIIVYKEVPYPCSCNKKPRTLRRYSLVNTETSHGYMRDDPAGDWVMWADATSE